jgi:hypothetical protein
MDRDASRPSPDGAGAPTGSATAALIGGIVIPAVAAPLVALALPIAFLLSDLILGELLGRPIHWYERDRGGMRMLSNAIAVMSVGAIAAALAGVPLVKYLFRSARPVLLFRVGAAGLLLVATAFWLWSTRNHPEYRFSAFWIALLGWIGSLFGLGMATWETEAGKRAKALDDARMAEQQKGELEVLMREIAEPSGTADAGEART